MLAGGLGLLAASATGEDWGAAEWTPAAVGALLYLAFFGTAFTFVVLTLLLRELSTLVMSYLPLLLPFGALLFGAALKDERLTAPSLAGAALVAAGLAVAQWRPRRLAPVDARGPDLGRLAPPPRRGGDADVDEQAGEADAERHDRLRRHA